MRRTRFLVIICVGISVGFLLGMGVSSLLRAMIAGGESHLKTSVTALVVSMAGILITYGLKSIPDSQSFVAQGNEIHLASPQPPASEVEVTKPLPAITVATTSQNGIHEQPEARVNGIQTPLVSIPAGVEPVVD